MNTSSLTLENGESITWNVTVTSDNGGLVVEGVDNKEYLDLNLSYAKADDAWGAGTWNITSFDDTAYGKKGHTYEIKVSANAAGTVYTVSVTDNGSTGSTTTPGSGGNGDNDDAGNNTPPPSVTPLATEDPTPDEPFTSDKIYVGLGGENLLKVSKVEVADVEQNIVHAELQPSSWNAISEFETVTLPAGQAVSFTFQQPTQGERAHNSWALAIYEAESYKAGLGQFVRGDTWLNKSTDAGFTGGIWSAGDRGADFTYETGQDYLTTASKLPIDKDVVVTVSFDGTDIEIIETVGGAKVMSASSKNWK